MRVTGETSFLLSRPSATVRGTGVAARYRSVAAAREGLGAGAPVVAGLLAFDTAAPAALLAPQHWSLTDQTVPGRDPAPTEPLTCTVTPSGTHRERVARALRLIADGDLEKVVLARTMELTFGEPVDADRLAARFAYGAGTAAVFAAPAPDDRWLIGASPELLVRRSGRIVTCHPFAGSAPRHRDPVADRAASQGLLDSAKDLAEHAFVVDDLRAGLTPLCTELDVPGRPALTSTGEMWHLATPIRGVLADESITALDLATLLSPTPAVCGTPRNAAAAAITAIEGPREFYGGAVGWCDARGDGEWLVAIRCLELQADRRSVRTWAGGGIVAGSDPDAEVAETDAKFRTVRRALGIGD
ncbi:isochorismate synthase [Gordonia iterans]